MEEKDEMTALIKELFSANERLKEENKRLESEVPHLCDTHRKHLEQLGSEQRNRGVGPHG